MINNLKILINIYYNNMNDFFEKFSKFMKKPKPISDDGNKIVRDPIHLPISGAGTLISFGCMCYMPFKGIRILSSLLTFGSGIDNIQYSTKRLFDEKFLEDRNAELVTHYRMILGIHQIGLVSLYGDKLLLDDKHFDSMFKDLFKYKPQKNIRNNVPFRNKIIPFIIYSGTFSILNEIFNPRITINNKIV